MTDRFIEYLTNECRAGKDKKFLLAVSGGVDSMSMAYLFQKVEINVGIAHCNFCLRGNESDMDEDFVKQYAEQNNFSFYVKRFDTEKYAASKNISTQMAARELRYEWFENIRQQHGYNFIATAHNLNDNIETLLFNLARGTGVKGLTGIQPTAGYVVRQLLFALRTEIESFAAENNIAFREDKSNAETKYTRNKIRHLVLPLLREINPSIEKTIEETISRMKETEQALEEYVSVIREKISKHESNKTVFDVNQLKNLLSNKTILYELFKPFGLSGAQTNELSEIIAGQTGGRVFTKTHAILKDRTNIVVSPIGNDDSVFMVINNFSELEKMPFFESVTLTPITGDYKIPNNKNIACLDEDEIKYPLIIRNWKDGDYFYPFGMTNKKKVSDFMIDNHISRFDKEKLLVLESGGKIVWLIGHRIDNRFRIKPATQKVLVIKII
jgi:tRNA(Ile)-lysidine synthase